MNLPDSQRQDEQQFDQYLYEVFLNDHIENEILRQIEYQGETPIKLITPIATTNANYSLV